MMTWLLFIVGIILTLVKVLYGHRAGSAEHRKKNYDKILHRIKRDSEAIHFTFEEIPLKKHEEKHILSQHL